MRKSDEALLRLRDDILSMPWSVEGAHISKRELWAFVRDALTVHDAARVEEHLPSCPTCAEWGARLAALSSPRHGLEPLARQIESLVIRLGPFVPGRLGTAGVAGFETHHAQEGVREQGETAGGATRWQVRRDRPGNVVVTITSTELD